MTAVSASACSATTTRCPTSRRWPTTCARAIDELSARRPARRRSRARRARASAAPETARARVGRHHVGDGMRVALAQINPTVGDIAGNEAKIREQLARAREAGAQLALFPELAITGYPPEDLLLKEHFLADARAAVERIAADAHGHRRDRRLPRARRRRLQRRGGARRRRACRRSTARSTCPTTASSTSCATSSAARAARSIEVDGVKVGLTICEDIWVPGRADDRRGAGRRAADRQHLRLALPARARAPSASR